jgi:ferric enterobactin receptor
LSDSNVSQQSMKKTLQIILFLFLAISARSFAQTKGIVKAKIMDAKTNELLSFASMKISQATENKLVTGNIANDKGEVSVNVIAGKYFVEIEFMGYKTFKSAEFSITKDNNTIDLGIVKLEPSSSTLAEVEVRAEKSTMVLALDKKIFNVGKDLANAGGSASDLLTNIPSVSVDPDGGVKLRGSDNVRILIDGKPSGLVSFKGGAGLQQLQGNMVERIEIITNPSARYEAEGMAGIINIILKKDQRQGFNGSLELIAGYPANYGVGGNLNYRHKKVNFFINYGLSYRKSPGRGNLYQEAIVNGEKAVYDQTNENEVSGLNNNIRGGLDYFFNEKSILTTSYLFKRSDAHRNLDIIYRDFAAPNNNILRTTYRNQTEDEQEPNSEYALTFKKDFTKKNHTISADVRFLDNWERSNQVFTQNAFFKDGIKDNVNSLLQNSLNDEYEKQWLFQVDYVHPIGKEGKLETGIRSSFRDMVNDYVVNQKNDLGQWIVVPGLKNYFIYNENINAWYGILGNKTKKFSYQAGLRAEWTDVKTTLRETNEVNPRQYANLFPSVHFTYNLPKENALQLSYSRRVRRPFYNDLSPFFSFPDSRNFFGGNPDLNPEFSNVFELGHIKYFEKGSFTSSLFFRDTQGKIDRIRRVDSTGFSRTRPENLNGEKSFGLELTSQFNLYKWWKLDFNFNFFRADIDGSNISDLYKRSTTSWFIRQTSRFTVMSGFDVQLRGNYEAPQKTAQGERLALYYIDLSMSKEIMQGKGTLNVNVTDLFNTRKLRYTTQGETFYSEGMSQFRIRQINVTLNYRFNQSKSTKKVKSLVSDEG